MLKLLEAHVLRDFFLEQLDNAKYDLSNSGVYEVNDINYRDLMFLEYGFYNEAIYTVPNTEQEFQTPGIFTIDGGEIINNPQYNCYLQDVAFEFLGFEAQREPFRKLLEAFASRIRGMNFNIWYNPTTGEFIYDDPESNEWIKYICVCDTELPVFGESVNQSGFERFPSYINFSVSVMDDIELSNDSYLDIDGDVIPVTALVIHRKKTRKPFNVRTEETQSYAESQDFILSFNCVIKTSSEACKKMKRGILSKNYLNEKYVIKYDGYTYNMFLEDGKINAVVGAPKELEVSFAILKEV